ncbi:actin-like ATPase domain-containing protein [Morchella conica CCBAS932]|uniref:Actin-like ATPase domain-containing protein n=1 Tax=Morchella conica CCBAS932 TaxID=1392247 RepID=A0A3N4LAK7_9PEZI|nr:actin-like ATPase domain-containing protein [Morchella conica CCBAS932]
MNAHSEPKIIVAVDFGTTFSGVAFAYTDEPDDKEVISAWPSGGNRTSDKVPTEVSYDDRAPGGYRWGFDIRPGQKRHQWFKLQLDPSQKLATKASSLARRYPSRTELPPGYSGDISQHVTNYLTALMKHTMGVLVKRYSQKFVDDTPIEYILTIPALWSDRARNLTFECAKKAGMTRISCISEPEAAAIYTLSAIQPNNLRLGDNFVVCDAGGGTVDLITYKVTQLDPLQVEESAVGDGGLCGSTYLNRRFEEYLENRIGAGVMAKIRPEAKASMIKEFDEFIKPNFSDLAQVDEYFVTTPGIEPTEANGIQDGFLIITRAEVRTIFEPVVSEVQELVLNQIRDVERVGGHIAAVLLVGGFGASDYLRKRLSACVDAEIMQPKNAWTAVVRGALKRGLEGPLISQRQARRHYGVRYWSKFREGVDPESSKFWSSFEGFYKCTNLMRWYLNKGDSVSETKAVTLNWSRTMGVNSNLTSEEVVIYCCDDDNAPSYKSWNTTEVCRLSADLSTIPRSKLTRRKSKTLGDPDQYQISYDLEMTMDSASISFVMLIDGIKYGSVQTEFV